MSDRCQPHKCRACSKCAEATPHAIRWEHDRDTVRATAVCHAPIDADCRLCCDKDCEQWGQIIRKDDGTIWHTIPGGIIPIHQMHDAGFCNVVEFLNVEPGLLPELAAESTPPFVIAETPIEPEWDGDTYLWKPSGRNLAAIADDTEELRREVGCLHVVVDQEARARQHAESEVARLKSYIAAGVGGAS